MPSARAWKVYLHQHAPTSPPSESFCATFRKLTQKQVNNPVQASVPKSQSVHEDHEVWTRARSRPKTYLMIYLLKNQRQCQSCIAKLVRRDHFPWKRINRQVESFPPLSLSRAAFMTQSSLENRGSGGVLSSLRIDWSSSLISHDTGMYNTISSSSPESNIMQPHYVGLIVKRHLCIMMASASMPARNVKQECNAVAMNMTTGRAVDIEGDMVHVIQRVDRATPNGHKVYLSCVRVACWPSPGICDHAVLLI